MGGAILYHDKIRAPVGYHLLFLLPLLVTMGTTILGRAPLAIPLVTGAVLLVLWALFSVLRVSVSRDQVYVQYGIFGPKIAVRDIERCEAVDYDWKQYGGWGIRYGADGSVAYNMMGDRGRAVRIVHKDGAERKVVLVASPDPERLAAAINEARTFTRGDVEEMRVERSEEGDEGAPPNAAEEEEAAEETAIATERRA